MFKLNKGVLILFFSMSVCLIVGGCSSSGEPTDSGHGTAHQGERELRAITPTDGAQAGSVPEMMVQQDMALNQDSRLAPSEGAVERKVIQEQRLEMDVQNLPHVLDRLERLVQEMEGAFIESIEEWQEVLTPQQIRYRAQAIFRIPVTQADQFVQQLEEEGNVLHRSTSGQDVTEEYVDNEARLRNLYRHEERLLELYEKADTVEDMIKLEAELSRIREQVEMIEGRQRYIDRVTSTVRITVDLTEVDIKQYLGHQPDEPIWAEAWAGLKESVADIRYGAKRGLVFLISSLPYLIIIAVLVIPLVWLMKRRINNKNQTL